MSTRKIVNLATLSSEEKKKFKEKYDAVFFDFDGTLSKFAPLPGAKEAVEALDNYGIRQYIMTDSCLQKRDDLVNTVKKYFPQIKEEDVMSTVDLLIRHLKKIGFDGKIYAMGERDGLVQDLRGAGFQVVSDDEIVRTEPSKVHGMELDTNFGAVVVGTDVNFNYLKLFKAVNYLQDPSVMFFSTILLTAYKTEKIFPVAGAFAEFIQNLAGREPPVTCSKASPESVKYIRNRGFDMERCLFVGDYLDADIAVGNLCGMDTLLLLTGHSTLNDVKMSEERNEPMKIPTFYAESVAVLAEVFNSQT